MTSHAILSPSGASRWFECPGSLWMCKDEPDTVSEYAKEGTFAHILAEYCFKFNKRAEDSIGKKVNVSGTVVDEDMASYVQSYIDTVNGIKDTMSDCIVFDVEQKFEFTDLLDLSTDVNLIGLDYTIERAYGTADAIILCDGELQIHDLKYGMGVRVDAENNKQLLIYALAAYSYYNLICDINKISVHIHQPRLDHYSSFSLTPEELQEFKLLLKDRASKAYSYYVKGFTDDEKSIALVPGCVQCRFCKASANCPALAEHVIKTVSDDFTNLDDDINNQIENAETQLSLLPNGELANKFKALDMIESWCKSVRTKVHDELSQGNKVPGFKLVIVRAGNRAWSSVEEAEKTLKSFRLKQDEMYIHKLISPTQATKLIKDNPRRLSRLNEIITRPEGKPTIVPETDKRSAISPADDFIDLTKEEVN